MPSALGPAALGLWAYISGKPLVPMLQLSNVCGVGEVKRLKSMLSGSPDLSRELAKAHQYSLQLERQLKQHLGMCVCYQ